MTFVIDASVALAAALGERIPLDVEDCLVRISSEGAIVPAIWPLEFGNGLVKAIRRNRVTQDYALARLDDWAIQPIVIEPVTTIAARQNLMLAISSGLTAYDVAYLELAVRMGYPLATLDDQLARAARSLSVEVIDGKG